MQSESTDHKSLKLIIIGIVLGSVSVAIALTIQAWISGPSEDLARIPPLPPPSKKVADPGTAAAGTNANDPSLSTPDSKAVAGGRDSTASAGAESGDSIALEADDIETSLPAKITDLKVAQGGRSIVSKLSGDTGLRIFDVADQSLRKLELNRTDFVFGAGGEKIVVYVDATNTITVYDLKTSKPLQERTFIDRAGIVEIVMGAGQDDMAFVNFVRNKGEFSQIHEIAMLDLNELVRERSVRIGTKISDRTHGALTYIRSANDLEVITAWPVESSPAMSGLAMWKRNAWGYGFSKFEHETGYLAVGNDGLVYTGSGEIFDESDFVLESKRDEPELVGRFRNRSLFPSVTGRFFVSMGLGWDLKLHYRGIAEPLGELRRFPGKIIPIRPDSMDSVLASAKADPRYTVLRLEKFLSGNRASLLTLDQRVTIIPKLDAIVFVPYSDDRLILRKMNIPRMLDQAGKYDCLVLSSPRHFAKAGREWTYEIKAIGIHEPLKFSLRQGPRSMTISDDGQLRWAVENGLTGSADVIVDITDSQGHMIPHPFTIRFE